MGASRNILYLLTESMVVIVICMIIFSVSSLYCFGVSAGDIQLEREDDGSSPPITLSIPFRFFGASENILYVSQLITLHALWHICTCKTQYKIKYCMCVIILLGRKQVPCFNKLMYAFSLSLKRIHCDVHATVIWASLVACTSIVCGKKQHHAEHICD